MYGELLKDYQKCIISRNSFEKRKDDDPSPAESPERLTENRSGVTACADANVPTAACWPFSLS